MILAATSYSDHPVPEKAAEEASSNALIKADVSSASLAFVFATAPRRSDYGKILKKVKKITGAKHVIGSSGYGVLTEISEWEAKYGVSVMVVESDTLEAAPFLIKNLQESSFKAGQNLAEFVKKIDFNPAAAMIFPDAYSFQSSAFFDGFENNYGHLTLMGGTSGNDGRRHMTFQIEGKESTYDAVSGVVLGGNNLRIEMGVTQSCQPCGEPVQITRADGHMIYEMDGRPAYDILLESLAHMDTSDVNELLEQVFLGLPLRSFQTEFSKSSYLIRHIMGFNAQKGLLTCASPVEQGDFVTFTVRDPERAKDDLAVMLMDLKSRIIPSEPKFGFYFNCCARGRSLYGEPNVDIRMIRQFFPRIPILGFFTYGEIAPLDFVNHLHHYSGVLALVTENFKD
ncbi:MAG: FIST C-terminal domain-containing protein [Candidatus Omnitrophica bacterium]|nr:FIST C-terminal domain-containing protein [Candidatus Omnitrophota bacterium]